jgi:hypothetical protein
METIERAPITGKEGAEIELHIAAEWTRNHRERHPHGSISQFFGQEILQRLLQQPGCLGIRIYYANSQRLNGWQKFIFAIANFLKKTVAGGIGEDHFILSGVTSQGLDLLPPNSQAGATPSNAEPQIFAARAAGASGSSSQNILAEQAYPCPGSIGCPQNVLTSS